MKMVKAFVTRLFKNESGAGMTEYALLVALVGVLLIGTIFALTGGIADAFEDATIALGGTATTTPPALPG